MLSSSFRALLRQVFTRNQARRPAANPRKGRCRPTLEALEDRLLLSTRVWDGSADGSGVPFTDAHWTSPQNWVGDVAPTAGDDLVFPATALRMTATNDFPGGTAFHSIRISGSNWTLNGNAVSLAAGITTTGASGANTVALPLTLTAPQAFFSGTAGSDLVLSGATIDNGGFALTVDGPGDAFFSGGSVVGAGGLVKNGGGQFILGDTAPDGYTGGTTVNGGALFLDGAAGNSVVGPLTVGGGSTGPTKAIARLALSNQVADSAAVTVNGSGLFDLNGFTDTIGPLTLRAGKVTTGTGLLTLGGNVTTLAAAESATILGRLDLGAGAARTFTVANGTTGTDLNVSATIRGAAGVALVKQGPGTLLLQGCNSYSGPTQVSKGTLAINDPSALGNPAAGTTVSAGASLVVEAPANGPALTFAPEPLVLDGGTLHAAGGASLVWRGTVTLASSSTVAADDCTALALTGLVTGPGNLTKTGAGEVKLTHANDYTGATLVKGGTLDADNAAALGATGPGSGTTVTCGAVLRLDGGRTFAPESLTLDHGTLESGSGDNTWAGLIQLAGPGNLGAACGAGLTVTSVISGPSCATLTKVDEGTVLLTAANTYAGETVVSDGKLAVRNATALGSPDCVPNAGTRVECGATLELRGGLTFDRTEALTLEAGSTLRDGSGDDTWAGTVRLAGPAKLDAADCTTLTVAGAISGPACATLTKVGAGTVVLAAPNIYAGRTDVCAGILAVTDPASLGATTAGTSVDEGATLELRGGVSVKPEPLTLEGAGVGGAGALRGVGGANAWSGAVTLAGRATIAADRGASLAVNGDVANEGYLLTVGGAGDTNVSSTISGAGGLTKNGCGTLTFSGASPNLYAGATTVNGGTLFLAKAATIAAVSGSRVTVNAGGTLAGSGIINSSVTNAGVVSPGGAGAVGTLTVNGGYVQSASGSLNVGLAGPGLFDVLAVAGAASLGGTLHVGVLGGYVPGAGTAFPVLSYASEIGAFATVTGLNLGLVYGPTGLELVA